VREGFAAFSLVAFIVAHVMLAVSVGRVRVWRGVIGLFVPPIVVSSAWSSGMKVRVWIWGAALLSYAIAVAIASW
jgi:hypothetical protein